MATIIVNTLTDELDGSIVDGDISLRDALAAAVSGDEIQFSSALFPADGDATANTAITLALGALTIVTDVTINGDVNGDGIADVTLDGNNTSGVFQMPGAHTLHLHALRIVDGNAANSGGALNVTNASATVFVSHAIFASNEATNTGGAIRSVAPLTIVNSMFSRNQADQTGGAVFATANLTVANSTFYRNNSNYGAGAIDGTSVNLHNTTLTRNTSYLYGYGGGPGAIDATTLSISNSIVLGNLSYASTNEDLIATTLLSNGQNIFGTSVTGAAPGDQLVGVANIADVFQSVGTNLLGYFNSITFGEVTRSNGITPAVGIALGGLAEDAGDNAYVPSESSLGFDADRDGTVGTGPLERDATGFDRIMNGTVDIGASENFGSVWTVDTTADIDDGDFSIGNLSLREAISNAADGDLILFDGALFTADADERVNTTITLAGPTLEITGNRSLTINGDTNGDGIADVTLEGSGAGGTRMMELFAGSALAIESMTFQNANVLVESGGVLASRGTLKVLNSSFIDNTTSGYGGALRLYSGSADIANSTFDGNTAGRGGAIRTTTTTNILNSTFYGNHASTTTAGAGGGAIEASGGFVTLQHTTITGNTAENTGGGVNQTGGLLRIENSAIVGNSENGNGTALASDDVSGSGSSNGGNVFGVSDITAAGDVTGVTAGDTFSAALLRTPGGIPVVGGVMGDNGGPTDTVLILRGGVASDQGVTADIPTETDLGIDVDGDGTVAAAAVDIDQRGALRVVEAAVDAGALEQQSELVIVTTTEDTRDGDTSVGDISWREAVDLVANGGTIGFDPSVFAVDGSALSNTTISVSNGSEYLASKAFHLDGDINGDGVADVTFDGAGTTAQLITNGPGIGLLKLEGLTFQNFDNSTGAATNGGVISSRDDLFVLNSNFLDNAAAGSGGALQIYSGNNVVAGSYFKGNAAYSGGGAIRIAGGGSTIIGSTFTLNSTANIFGSSGGAIDANGSTAKIINSTITGNYANYLGGGVIGSGSGLRLYNSIVAGNASPFGYSEAGIGFQSNGRNIFGSSQASYGYAPGDVVLGSSSTLGDVFDETALISISGATVLAGVPVGSASERPSVSLNATNTANPALDTASAVGVSEAALGIDLNFDGDMIDTVLFDGRGFTRSVDLPGLGTDIPDIGAFEVQTVTTRGADFLTGSGGDDTLDGLAGGDNISGLAGNDSLSGGNGDDRVNGGADNDRLDGAGGNDTLVGVGGNDTINGGNQDDLILGGTGDNVLRGQGGNDSLVASSGIDQLAGGSGVDTLDAGGGNDELLGQGDADLLMGNVGDDTLRGGSGNDTLYGGDNNDEIYGQGNVDILYGETGNDTLFGGSGNDILRGGEDADQLFGQGNNDSLIGEGGNDTLVGAAGSDTLQGGTGDDDLRGGDGGDRLAGGAGDDVLNGGANADVLYFGLGFDNDTIAGFQDNIDTIEIASALAGGQTVALLLANGAITSQVGGNVVMDFGGGDILQINNIGIAALLDDMVIV